MTNKEMMINNLNTWAICVIIGFVIYSIFIVAVFVIMGLSH